MAVLTKSVIVFDDDFYSLLCLMSYGTAYSAKPTKNTPYIVMLQTITYGGSSTLVTRLFNNVAMIFNLAFRYFKAYYINTAS